MFPSLDQVQLWLNSRLNQAQYQIVNHEWFLTTLPIICLLYISLLDVNYHGFCSFRQMKCD